MPASCPTHGLTAEDHCEEVERLRNALVRCEDQILARDAETSALKLAARAVLVYEWGEPNDGHEVAPDDTVSEAGRQLWLKLAAALGIATLGLPAPPRPAASPLLSKPEGS